MGEEARSGGLWKVAEDRWSSTVDAASTALPEDVRSGEISVSIPRAEEEEPCIDSTGFFRAPNEKDESSANIVVAKGIVPLVVVGPTSSSPDVAVATGTTGTDEPETSDSLMPVVAMPPTFRPPPRPRGVRWPFVASASLLVLAIVLATAAATSLSAGASVDSKKSSSVSFLHAAPRR
jgi:hypothetical protein